MLPDYQDLLLAALGPAPEITSIQTLNLHAVSTVIVAAGDRADKKQKLKAVCTNRALLSEEHKKNICRITFARHWKEITVGTQNVFNIIINKITKRWKHLRELPQETLYQIKMIPGQQEKHG